MDNLGHSIRVVAFLGTQKLDVGSGYTEEQGFQIKGPRKASWDNMID